MINHNDSDEFFEISFLHTDRPCLDNKLRSRKRYVECSYYIASRYTCRLRRNLWYDRYLRHGRPPLCYAGRISANKNTGIAIDY